MMDFWIIFGVIGLFALPLAFMFAYCGVDTKTKVFGSLFVIAFWVLFSGALYFQEQGNQERWNNGFCECGQHWELSAVNKTRNGTETKYYTCPDCYKEIQIIH